LEKSDLIESQLQQPVGKGPARKVYNITQAGWQAQIEGTTQALSTPQFGATPFLLGLSNFPIVPRDQVLVALEAYRDRIKQRLEYMLARAEAQQPLPPFVQAMFDYSQVLAEAEINWIQKFIQEVEVGNV
jgi:hypothetical protein